MFRKVPNAGSCVLGSAVQGVVMVYWFQLAFLSCAAGSSPGILQ